MDTIFIREFRVDAWVGIYEWEKQRPQTLEMEIEIGIPGNAVGRTDNIHDTVHYGEVVQRITTDLSQRKFKLLEALAEHVCDVITGEFKAPWVKPDFGPGDAKFQLYPKLSIEEWHRRRGLWID